MKRVIFLFLSVFFIGCQIEPSRLGFRPPHVLEDIEPALPTLRFQGFPPFTAFYAKEINGMKTEMLVRHFLGGPHKKLNQPGETESWISIFQRIKPGMRPPHDTRRIKNIPAKPPNLVIAVVIQDNLVAAVQTPWYSHTPVSAQEVKRFFGNPDKTEVTANGENFFYRFACFTSHKGELGEMRYMLCEAVLKIAFEGNGN